METATTRIYSRRGPSTSIFNNPLRHYTFTTSIAATAVFATTELLEHILSSLTLVDLAHAERVSRKWRDVIASSAQLKRTLFMEARPAEQYATLSTYDNQLSVSADKSWPWMIIDSVHPALCAELVPYNRYSDNVTCTIDLNLLTNPVAEKWERGYISQPPCKKVHIRSAMQSPSGMWRWDDTGVRLGSIGDSVKRERSLAKVTNEYERRPLGPRENDALHGLVAVTMKHCMQRNDPKMLRAVYRDQKATTTLE
ncbi:hypothetical protein LTR17_013068 [Elasticomyces elasticus]|nr:hypothetical protein LTR17_013068 [Elasticomyces elasticus]